MLRIFLGIVLVIIGSVAPVWLFLVALFVSVLVIYNFWEIIPVTILINSLYVYQGDFFSARYVVWGVIAYVFGFFVHRMTRLHNSKK